MVNMSTKRLYETVADHIRGLIQQGTLQTGDRLPSVRKLHQQLSVSISTVLEAYRLLEDQGIITVRPQSGYYVKTHVTRPEPNPSQLSPQSTFIDTSLVARICADMEAPHLVKLGAALPSTELLPTKALNRLMGQVIRNSPDTVHTYHTPQGDASLRREVAKKLMDAGCAITAQDVMITNGTTEAVFLALQTVTKPGDTVAIESPCYYVLLQALEILNLRALEIPTDPREGISLSHLEAALKRSEVTACALVSNFSNPLGSCMNDRNKQALVQLLSDYQVPLIEDDTYGDLYFGERRPTAIKAFDTEGIVLYCASISKTLSPGLKIGWLVSETHLAPLQQRKLVTNLMSGMASQLTVSAFLQNGGYERHLRRLRRTYSEQLEKMWQTIRHTFPPQVKMTSPQGGQVLWLEFPEKFDVLLLYQAALEHRIAIAPGIIFSPSQHYRNCMRLNFGLMWSDTIKQALEILGALAQQQLSTIHLENFHNG